MDNTRMEMIIDSVAMEMLDKVYSTELTSEQANIVFQTIMCFRTNILKLMK